MTRTTNSHHVAIQMMGKGQGQAKEGTTGAAGALDMTHLEPLGMFFFFSFIYFLSTKCSFALRTTWMTMNGHYHHRTPSPSP